MSYWVAGINHMAWFLELKWRGKDAYPLLREKFKDPEIYSRPDVRRTGPDIVRAEIFKAFGYFSTEGSKHMSEYVPYFRKRPELIERFKLLNLNDFETRAKMKREGDEELRQQLSTDQKFPISHSGEYASIIIRSIETGSLLGRQEGY
jgi:alpha-galactosidase